MPYYWWRGINLEGFDVRGMTFARSQMSLDANLLKLDIGLIKARQNLLYLFLKPISSAEKQEAINYAATLLKSYIKLNIALQLVANSIKHPYLKAVYQDISQIIEEGELFSQAVAQYPDIFDELSCTVISCGEASGDIAGSLKLLAGHNKTVADFNKKLRSALLMPTVSFIAFCVLLLAVFIFIIPRFEVFFNGFNKPLPKITSMLIGISRWLNSLSIVLVATTFILVIILIKLGLRSFQGRIFADKLALKLPVIGNFNKLAIHAKILNSLSILLSGHVHLKDALEVSQTAISNNVMKSALNRVILNFEGGMTLSAAIEKEKLLAMPDFIAMLKIGESSGQLSLMVDQAAKIYLARLYEKLNWATTLVQPIVLIILGILIASIVSAVYIPIFTLSSLIV